MDKTIDQHNVEEYCPDFQKPKQSNIYLTLYVCTTLLLVWTAFLKWKRNKGLRPGYLGYFNWVSFSVPILQGFILYWKGRKYGLTILSELVGLPTNNASVVKVGLKNVYFVWDINIIQDLLKSDNSGYLGKPKEFYDLVFPGPLTDGLISSALNLWRPHRKAIAPAFSYRSLKIYFQYTNKCALQFIRKSLKEGPDGSAISQEEMQELLDYYGIKQTTQTIMGKSVSSATKDTRLSLANSFRIGKHITIRRFMNPLLLLPLVWRFHPQRLKQEEMMATGFNYSSQVIQMFREKQLESSQGDSLNDKSTNVSKSNDDNIEDSFFEDSNPTPVGNKSETEPVECLLQHLLKSGLSDKEMIDEVTTFLVAGYETVRVALDLLIFQLALNPHCQRKCQEEVDSVLPPCLENGTETSSLTWDDLSKLKYLEQCILESLRITPTVPLYARELQMPMQVNSTLTAKRGEVVVVAPWIIHRHASYFPNPHVFDPDRFTAENIKKRHPFCYLPFSSGKRGCPGNKLAMIQMKVFMARIIQHFKFSTTDKPDDVKLYFAVTVEPERPYNIVYTKRCV